MGDYLLLGGGLLGLITLIVPQYGEKLSNVSKNKKDKVDKNYNSWRLILKVSLESILKKGTNFHHEFLRYLIFACTLGHYMAKIY